jgi:hypothetical protein
MRKLGWVLVIAWWLYFITGLFLYVHLRLEWVNTVDVLLTFGLLIVCSVWYVIEKFRSGPEKSRWMFGWNGQLYRRKSRDGRIKQRR